MGRGQVGQDTSDDTADCDPQTFETLRHLLGLPPATARRIRDAAPRRRPRRRQVGPGLDLGSPG